MIIYVKNLGRQRIKCTICKKDFDVDIVTDDIGFFNGIAHNLSSDNTHGCATKFTVQLETPLTILAKRFK